MSQLRILEIDIIRSEQIVRAKISTKMTRMKNNNNNNEKNLGEKIP